MKKVDTSEEARAWQELRCAYTRAVAAGDHEAAEDIKGLMYATLEADAQDTEPAGSGLFGDY